MARKRSSKLRKLHPLVAAYIKTGSIIQPIKEIPPPRGQLLDTMLMLIECRHGKVAVEDTLRAAEQVPAEGHDPDLYLCFLGSWINAANQAGRLADMSALIKRAKSLVNPRTPPELLSHVLEDDALLAVKMGDMVERERCSRLALANVSRESGHHPTLLLTLAQFLAWVGRGRELEADLDGLTAEERRRHANGIAVTRLAGAVTCGRAAEAVKFLRAISPRPEVQAFYGVFLDGARSMLRLMLRHWQTAETAAARSELAGESFLDAPASAWPDWERMNDSLARRRPEEALGQARDMAARGIERFINEYGFDAYSLVRAELSAGNGEAARRIVEIRQRRGNRQYLDDFFLARAELLAGRPQEAARRFAAVAAACERYGAMGRLDFELHLSCELSAGQALYLAREAAQLKADAAPVTAAVVGPEPGKGPFGAARLLGASPAIARLRAAVTQFAPLDVPVLITGETGTGKELAARAIHESGPRAAAPFVAVNCGAISESLLESELFGHEKGAFTGAERAHRGLFEEAADGTILLDEVGEMPVRLQVALLRVLESGEIRPVGSARDRKVACRIVAATNADLDTMVAAQRFRQDLLYRLRRLELPIPPLRARAEDILPLAESFLNEGRAGAGRAKISAELGGELRRRDWPGNVRELRNTIERMRLLNSDKLAYDVADLNTAEREVAPRVPASAAQAGPASPVPGGPQSGGVAAAELAVLDSERTMMRQLERLRGLFARHGRLTRKEITRILDVAPATAAKYLKTLRADGTIDKVTPSASPRSHYFRLRG
jgi:DNA-binding NtrC family response regulator